MSKAQGKGLYLPGRTRNLPPRRPKFRLLPRRNQLDADIGPIGAPFRHFIYDAPHYGHPSGAHNITDKFNCEVRGIEIDIFMLEAMIDATCAIRGNPRFT